MFLRFLKKKNQEDNKIQELEQTIHKLEMEIDRLKSDVIKEDKTTDRIIEVKNNQDPLKKEDRIHSADNIKILSSKDAWCDGKKAVKYELDHGVLRDNVISVIQVFEKENIKMSRCHVDTYSDSGSCSGCTFKNIKDLEQLKSFPSPYMTFYVDYANTLNDQYQYSMKCSTNNNRCFVYVDLRKKND